MDATLILSFGLSAEWSAVCQVWVTRNTPIPISFMIVAALKS
jgi:hypothetical protein